MSDKSSLIVMGTY